MRVGVEMTDTTARHVAPISGSDPSAAFGVPFCKTQTGGLPSLPARGPASVSPIRNNEQQR